MKAITICLNRTRSLVEVLLIGFEREKGECGGIKERTRIASTTKDAFQKVRPVVNGQVKL